MTWQIVEEMAASAVLGVAVALFAAMALAQASAGLPGAASGRRRFTVARCWRPARLRARSGHQP